MSERSFPVTLIFPALTAAGKEYFDNARLHGERVLAAASVRDPDAEVAFGELIILPFVHDPNFAEALLQLVESRRITRIHAPVASVYAFLEGLIVERGLSIGLVGESPIRRQVYAYRQLIAKAGSYLPLIVLCGEGGKPTLSLLHVAAVFRQAALIYGESNDDKIAALMGVFASAPKGDVVEIGSQMGRSLFVLKFLASHYRIGPVLSVDPLSADCCVQVDSPEAVRKTMVNEWDYDILRQAFAVNLLPFGGEGFNYLRLPSVDAVEVYRSKPEIESSEFGRVLFHGKIALIHIDGNHDYSQVRQDCDLWLSLLIPGAWVILDDYLWAHGDGPHKVGDTLLTAHKEKIDRSFVCGKALFIKYK